MVVAHVADGAAKLVMDPTTAASSSRFHCVFHCCQPVLKICNANVGLTEGRESGGSSDSSDSGNDSGDDSGKGVDGNDSSDGVIDLIKNYKCAFFIPVDMLHGQNGRGACNECVMRTRDKYSGPI
ncbi:hypothetical protein VTJ04DRAFT_10243 [Mycothermus thermophilus]|uniref:uncharacterized protein n=1 Tax=Humicola insolens TaxID=85995 RepID=UPI00374407D8